MPSTLSALPKETRPLFSCCFLSRGLEVGRGYWRQRVNMLKKQTPKQNKEMASSTKKKRNWVLGETVYM